ncbi:Hsp70 family protein [Salinibacterium sp. G-O1]|uniref:Hsp70 family protein n=1 Tax=Salinibacterium sp. G-O1 TaxID=3046208 RepID=UPI0024B9E8B9|nr:Hsp70 family protein [Salinibacterium sp. G-O1]MDJ0334596.1 Hsp70 family protein [Salinibacterium sp. G-O1]
MNSQVWSLAIDFGTSNTAAAFTIGGKTRPISLDASSTSMPSAVLLTDDGFVTGRTALSRMRLAPRMFVGEPKRDIGSSTVTIGDRSFEPAELVAEVFRVIKSKAHDVAGPSEPDRVILTHPQEWTEGQEDTLRRAAELAGFEPDCIVLVSEPIAAVHYYAVENPPNELDRVAVVDIGGGTCDVAVLEKNPHGSEFDYSLLAAGGDNVLGGTHFDARLWDWTIQQLGRRDDYAILARLHDPADPRGRLILRDSIRTAKEELSERADSIIAISVGDSESVVSITRDEYEAIIADDVARAVRLVADVLNDAGASRSGTTLVYLTGGASRTPAIIDAITKLMGTSPAKLHDPKLVVAEGALSAPPQAVGEIAEVVIPVAATLVAENQDAAPPDTAPTAAETPAAETQDAAPPVAAPPEVPVLPPPPGGSDLTAPPPPEMPGPAGEPLPTPAFAPRRPWYKGPLLALPIIGGLLLMAIFAGVVIVAIAAGSAGPVRTPTPTPTATRTSDPPPTAQCWDGSSAPAPANCPELVGTGALLWAFPTATGVEAPDCTVGDPFDPIRESLTCEWSDLPDVVVFIDRFDNPDEAYSFWDGIAAAGPTRTFDRFALADDASLGTTWSGTSTGETSTNRMTIHAYASIPFSIAFYTDFTTTQNEADHTEAVSRLEVWLQSAIDSSTP